jgi:hypothetical protein
MTQLLDNLNVLLDFYYDLNEVRFKLVDNIRTPYAWDEAVGKLVPLFEATPQIPLEPGILEMRSKIHDFFESSERFFWLDGEGAVQKGLNPSLSYDELSPFLFGDCSNLSGTINPRLIGDVSYLTGEINSDLRGRILPSLEGDVSNLYGNMGLGIDPWGRLSGTLNKDLTGDLSGVKGMINPKLTGDLSGALGTINPDLFGDCSNLTGFISGLTGNCTGLYGRVINLIGDCSNLIGDCTGIEGDCTGASGNLDNIPLDLKPTRLGYVLNKLNPPPL